MKRVLLLCILVCFNHFAVQAQPVAVDTWDLVQAYDASTHVFYGTLTKSIPEPDFRTGVRGVQLSQINQSEVPTQSIIWKKAHELTFRVSEQFKGPAAENFVAFRADPDLSLWTYVQNEAGDVFLAQPEALDPLIAHLDPGEHGLFFIRYYLGSTIPVIYRARFGQPAQQDLALLRAHQTSGGSSLKAIQQQARLARQAQAQREAAEFRVLEDEYYKILRIQDLEIRSHLLNDLITRMGFEGRWTFFDFKERYLNQYGAYLEDGKPQQVPSGPETGKEKIWKDASEELSKIDFVLKARAARP